MSLFQKTVEQKYLKLLDSNLIETKYNEFKLYFGNPTVQENIRNSKEEQFQEGFLRELFVKILGYTLNPSPDFNLTTEYKNVKDSKKADGAVLINAKVKAIIELKGTDTTDLAKVEVQAFGYKNNQPDCVYIITSNFEKLRFYIDNAIEHTEFNLFALTKQDFERLYLCLSFDSIAKGIPKKIKDESVSHEDKITKELYRDYSVFKAQLYQNLVELNPQVDQLTLYKKSQKLLDRFLFLFFAEDRFLLPVNYTRIVIKQWKQLKDLDEYIPLYERFKKHFNYLNTGYKGGDFEVYAYNGGLFKPDDILDSVLIDDNLLYNHTLKISEYDFASEVDVNILGHIFENSLNEIDEIKAQLDGSEVDKAKTKRKKDGVFYTPKYITKYIVDNTVGKLCADKKLELEINEEDYTTDKKRQKKTKAALFDKLKVYREWLLQLTICDPACGSGAFLNQALDFLITEHRYIDELQAKLFGDSLVLSDIEKSILENNLFGVDLNEESVEIAKLSLWLRTAQPYRKLSNLNNNIKCGNSLIDDPAVAGDKAFSWQKEFPQVFEKGGFDVIIGNPPYVSKTFNEDIKTYFKKNYKTAEYQLELYVFFMELAVLIAKKFGKLSFILPNSWMKNLMFGQCRFYLLSNVSFDVLIPNLDNVFSDASVDTCIFISSNNLDNNEIRIGEFKNNDYHFKHVISQKRLLENEKYIFDIEISNKSQPIFKKIESSSIKLEDICDVTRGINPYDKYSGQSEEIIRTRAYHAGLKKDETFVPELRGKHINRYCYNWDNSSYVSYGDWLAAPRERKYFEGERILCRQVLGSHLNCCIISENFIIDQSVFIAKIKQENINLYSAKFVLSLFASKLISYYFRNKANEFDALFPKIKIGEFRYLPIKKCSPTDQKPLIDLSTIMTSISNEFISASQKFQRTIQRKFSLEELSNKLQDWHTLTYKEFIAELGKRKVKLSLSDEAEWEDYFLQEQKKALELKAKIEATDKEIDQMVYKLYNLTEEEIAIVEGSAT